LNVFQACCVCLNPCEIEGPAAGRPDVPGPEGFPEEVPPPCLGFPLLALDDDWLEEVCLELVPVGGTVLDVAEVLAFGAAEEAEAWGDVVLDENAVVVWLFSAVVFRPPCAFEPVGWDVVVDWAEPRELTRLA